MEDIIRISNLTIDLLNSYLIKKILSKVTTNFVTQLCSITFVGSQIAVQTQKKCLVSPISPISPIQ